jgi:hypothetical protein
MRKRVANPAQMYSLHQLHRGGASTQVTVPKCICDLLNMHRGDKVWVYTVGGVVCIRKFDGGGFAPGVVAVGQRVPAGVEGE